MTARKIAISIPEELYATIRAKVDAGEAASVSGLITETLRDALTEDSLDAFFADMQADAGETEPSPADRAWVEEAHRQAELAVAADLDFAERAWAAAAQLERDGTWPGDVHR